jgi:hypothetical protein
MRSVGLVLLVLSLLLAAIAVFGVGGLSRGAAYAPLADPGAAAMEAPSGAAA